MKKQWVLRATALSDAGKEGRFGEKKTPAFEVEGFLPSKRKPATCCGVTNTADNRHITCGFLRGFSI